MSLQPGATLGPYTLKARLGAGGMGEVYTALDTRLDRLVALKVLSSHLAQDPTARARFDREAKAIAGLNHPNVCALFDIGRDQGHEYLVMELLEGATLQERLQQGPLDVVSLVTHAIALADALDTAHGRGLIHRDLKPANIFLTTRDVPKILDFGLAKTLEGADDATRPNEALVTTLGTTVGTLAYMSPEQLRGETVDARTDLFSLGLVLYEMATGQRAFSGPTMAVISAAILAQDAAPPRTLRPDLPQRLEDTILKAIEKDRALRCQTAAELRADLMRIRREMSDPGRMAVLTSATAPMQVTPTAERRRSSSLAAIVGVAGILVGVIAASGYWWTHRGAAAIPPPQSPPGLPPATPTTVSSPVPPPDETTPQTKTNPAPRAPTPPPKPAPAEPPASTVDARSNVPSQVPNAAATRGRGRAFAGPAGAALVTTLRNMPAQQYHIVFAAGNVQAREFAVQMQTALNAAGWTSSGLQPTQEPASARLTIGVPRRTPATNALFNWATRSGLNPDYRILPQLKEVRLVIGSPK
jgi:serine/threonine protein kinase